MPVNNRQRDVINRLLDGFTGKLTTTKGRSHAGVSREAGEDHARWIDPSHNKKAPGHIAPGSRSYRRDSLEGDENACLECPTPNAQIVLDLGIEHSELCIVN